jgi:hypothetical protein
LLGLLIYALFPLLGLFRVVLRAGVNLLLAMPQTVWWVIGVTIVTVWGVHLLLRLGKRALPNTARPFTTASFHGRLSELRESLYGADSSTYAQDRIRQCMSTLTIDLISLRLDISEEEARKLHFKADWTEDEILKSFFDRKRNAPDRTQKRLTAWFKKSKPSPFLKETAEILDRLTHYRHSVDLFRSIKFPIPRLPP